MLNGSPNKDATAGAHRIRGKYLGPDETLRKMAIKIREAARDPKYLPTLRQFAEAVMLAAGYKPIDKPSHEECAQVFLDYVRANVRYRPDPPMVEFVQGAHITLCVPGAVACIPVED